MQKIWAFLMHLGTNNWSKKGRRSLSEKDCKDFIYREELFCDKEVWRKVTEFLPTCGINTLNNKELMTATKRFADPKGIAGFMSAPWMLTTPKKYYALLNDAFTFGNAKADIYGE